MSHDSTAKGPSQRLGRRLLVISALLLVALAAPTAASAQWIRGTLVDHDTGTPIEGAAIVALTTGDRQVAWILTDAAGRFFFRLTTGGRFVLRADRIGHASTRSEVLEVGPGDTLVYRMEARVEPIELMGLNVEGSARDCKIRPEEGVATAQVWEEARKALEAAAQTSRRGTYRFMIRRFERELDKRGRNVLKETSRLDRRFEDRPFRTLETSTLIEHGFVQAVEDTAIYYAPDADVLLSDEFLDSHCLRLRSGDGEDDGLLGLEFEPTGDRDVPEISGTLWLDPGNAELQRLEYRYENLGFSVGRAPVGGTVVFAGLPNGTWFVRAWSIRMPIVDQQILPPSSFAGVPQLRPTKRVVGIHEEGALVLQVRDWRGDVVVGSEEGAISGVVVGEDSQSPVADAVVSVWITGQEAITGEDGLFRFNSLGGGIYDVLVTHPSLTSLGYGGELTQVPAASGEVTSVRLTLPRERSILDEVCVGPGPDEGGIVAGWVRNTETDEPIPGATVRLTTVTYQREGTQGIRRQESSVEVTTRDDGFFIYCGMPVDALVDVDVDAEGMRPWNGTARMLNKGLVAHLTVQLEPVREDP